MMSKKVLRTGIGLALVALAVAIKFGPFVTISQNATAWAWLLLAALGVVVILLAFLPTIRPLRAPSLVMRQINPFRKRNTPAFYVEVHRNALAALGTRGISERDAKTAFQRRVDATWGLINLGAESIPAALGMLGSADSDVREDGAGVLGEIGRDDKAFDSLIQALDRETDQGATDSILLALGATKNKAAIPTLARIIRDESADGDTRHTAVESLGKIIRKRFIAQKEPIQAAIDWLASSLP